MTTTHLRGTTWGHTRGYLPMVATAQRFRELHPHVDVEWEQRSLQAFADLSIGGLAEEYDLLVIDHPWIAHAATRGHLLPLDDLLPAALLEEHRRHSVGPSFASYTFGGRCWALPIDAASPVASYRPDLLAERGLGVPRTWDDLLALARGGGVILPAIPLDTLGHFNMLCDALGEAPFQRPDRVVSGDVGVAALEALRELATHLPAEAFRANPIRVYEAMATGSDFLYCPSGYGYSNYCRRGYAEHGLRFTTMVRYANGARLRGTLGGAGLAISARCRHLGEAAAYAAYVGGAECQRGLYAESGGQPAHRTAWVDDRVNGFCDGFFRDTLDDLDHAFLRPQYDGYLVYQDAAGDPVWEYMTSGGDPRRVVEVLNSLYRRSLGSASGLTVAGGSVN